MFDIAFAIHILLNFITAYQMDIEWKDSLKDIAKSYAKSFLIFDLISTLPTLITNEHPSYYWFKILRYVHFRKFLHLINHYLAKIFVKIGLSKQSIERIFYFITYTIFFV
jgi:hypothetical protein